MALKGIRKMKIAIYGIGIHCGRVLHFVKKCKNVEILCFITSSLETETYCGYDVVDPNSIPFEKLDYIVLASQKYQDEMRSRINEVICGNNNCTIIGEYDFMSTLKPVEDMYSVCTVDGGISYVSSSKDIVIAKTMSLSNMNWSSEIIDFALSFKTTGDLFFDIGANIGTTCIYVKKMFPQLCVYGFEPGKKNFDLLRINMILNNVEEINAVNCALSDKSERLYYKYDEINPGGSHVNKNESSNECCDSIALDEYMDSRSLEKKRCGYLWIDTEGYEACVIIGAEKTIHESHPYIVMEYDANEYIQQGNFDKLINILETNYSYFIDLSKGCSISNKMKIGELVKYSNIAGKTDMFFF